MCRPDRNTGRPRCPRRRILWFLVGYNVVRLLEIFSVVRRDYLRRRCPQLDSLADFLHGGGDEAERCRSGRGCRSWSGGRGVRCGCGCGCRLKLNADFPIFRVAHESPEDDRTGSEDGEKRLHFFFLGNRLSNRSDNVKATVAMGRTKSARPSINAGKELRNAFSVDLSLKTGSNLGMSPRIIQVRPSRNPRWQKQGGWEVFEAEGHESRLPRRKRPRFSFQLRTATRRLWSR